MRWFNRSGASEAIAAPAVHISRRGFLGGFLAALTVPAIVKVDSLVAVTPELIAQPELVIPDYLWVARFDVFQHGFKVNAVQKAKAIGWTDIPTQSFRALPDDLCKSLTQRYGRYCSPDHELELILQPEDMGLPAFGSLVPKKAGASYGRAKTSVADIAAGLKAQEQIDQRTGNVGI